MNKLIHLETERTFMRQLVKEDSYNYYSLNLDEDVLKFTGDKPFSRIQDAIKFLENYDQYEKYRVGRLAVIDKGSLEFLGWCGLKYSVDRHEYDIGFRFFKKYWNKGYATETSQRCLEYGFDELGIERIVGRARKENLASIQVMEKIGMTYLRAFDFDGHPGVIYHCSRKK